MKKKIIIMMGFLTCLLAYSLVQTKSVFADSKIKVVTTFYPVYEFTKQITSDTADVSMLIQAGIEPHDFEPSTKNIATIQKADVFVYMTDSLETWAKKVSKDQKNLTVINATSDMLLTKGSVEEDDEDDESDSSSVSYDPHVWLSPKRAILLVEAIRDKLVKAYPDKADTFNSNAESYIKKLTDLDTKYTDSLQNAKQKSFVTQHAAFGYLALDYGLKQVAITGLSPDEEPSAKRLSSLAKYIEKYGIGYIYFEENASSKVAKTLASEANVKTKVLNPLESLTEEETKAGEDYISTMEKNLVALELTTNVAGKEVDEETDTSKTVENGYFNSKNVKDRTLSDWTGSWQSIYPYVGDGTFDAVWDYKAKLNKDKSAEDYKTYYSDAYQTDVEKITIDGKKNTITFVQNGEEKTYTYKYKGYKIVTYEAGNRGVRYLFETSDKNAGDFKYVQISDQNIAPTSASHFQILFGSDSQDSLLKDLDHFPTYYPVKSSGKTIAQALVVE